MAIAISERLFYSPFEGPICILGAEVKIISDISKTDQGRVHQFVRKGFPGMIPLELGESWTGDLLTMPPSEIHIEKNKNQQKWKFAEESVNLYSHDWRILQEGQPLSTTAQKRRATSCENLSNILKKKPEIQIQMSKLDKISVVECELHRSESCCSENETPFRYL